MSTHECDPVIEAIGHAVARWQDAMQAFDRAVGERLGLGLSEQICLAFLASGPKSAGEISEKARLTPAAITALLDRLEQRDLVRRLPDGRDRRKILVTLSKRAERINREVYGGIAGEGRAFLGSFSLDELKTILRFVDGAQALQQKHTKRIGGETKDLRGAADCGLVNRGAVFEVDGPHTI